MLRETDGKGPYCSLVMAVVVVKDVVVFLCFAINIEFVRVVRALVPTVPALPLRYGTAHEMGCFHRVLLLPATAC